MNISHISFPCFGYRLGDLPYILKADQKTQEIEGFMNIQTRQEIDDENLSPQERKKKKQEAKLQKKKQIEMKKSQRQILFEEKKNLDTAKDQYNNALFSVTDISKKLADNVEAGTKKALNLKLFTKKKEADEAKERVDTIRKSIRQSQINLDFDDEDLDGSSSENTSNGLK